MSIQSYHFFPSFLIIHSIISRFLCGLLNTQFEFLFRDNFQVYILIYFVFVLMMTIWSHLR